MRGKAAADARINSDYVTMLGLGGRHHACVPHRRMMCSGKEEYFM